MIENLNLKRFARKRPLRINIGHKIRAVDVLYQKMIFYNDEAREMGLRIYKLLKEGEKARGDKIADMYKALMRLNDLVIECATKLAPYQSPKLESTEIKQKIEHRFVIRAPSQLKSTNDWISNVRREALPPPNIPKRPIPTGQNIIEIEDAEIIPNINGADHGSYSRP